MQVFVYVYVIVWVLNIQFSRMQVMVLWFYAIAFHESIFTYTRYPKYRNIVLFERNRCQDSWTIILDYSTVKVHVCHSRFSGCVWSDLQYLGKLYEFLLRELVRRLVYVKYSRRTSRRIAKRKSISLSGNNLTPLTHLWRGSLS